MQPDGLRTWIGVSEQALRKNYNIFRKLISKKTQLMAVVKSNAYGHSLLDFTKTMERFGADWLGVDSIVEARTLRRERINSQMLVLGHTMADCMVEAAEKNVSITISNLENLKAAVRLHCSRPLKTHIKVDTGMHRQGFFLKDLPSVVKILKQNRKKIIFEGIYTHFAAAKNPAFPQETQKQISEFKKCVALVESHGFRPMRHTCATSGTILFPKAHFDMVRIGIGMYGRWPSKEVEAASFGKLKLVPALSWKTVIAEIKQLPVGSGVGYDLTEKLARKSRVAILPIGYWHGYPRALSGIGQVLIRGMRAKVIGRISMDMTVVDITDIPRARTGDIITLLGKDGKDEITADWLGNLADSFNYELVTRLNPLIKRVYT